MLYQNCAEITIAKGKPFIKEGQKEKQVGYILEGAMRQYYSRANGEGTTTYFYFENNLVSSYVSSTTATPSLITIEALEKQVGGVSLRHIDSTFCRKSNGESSVEK